MKTKKWEIILFSVILAAAAIWWAVLNFRKNRTDHGSIEITINGEPFGTYDLGKDQVIDIPTTDFSGNSRHNVCTIRDGKALMTDADCPDKVCMYMPAIDEKGGYICCLPHGIFIMGTPSADAVSEGTGIDSVG